MSSRTTGTGLRRCRISVRGRVQGVGFRPTLYRALTSRGCAGCIRNTPEGVTIEAEAEPGVLRRVVEDFHAIIPERARVDEFSVEEIEPQGETEFRILRSEEQGHSLLPIPPDLATCAECRRELEDPANRRHLFPFDTCTACGPRFTIAREVPFDRDNNAMREFPPCRACAREYAEPAERRFHAQTLSCPACGPSLALLRPDGRKWDAEGEPLALVRELLRDGAILAIKGLGGFHLACDATREGPVRRLRERKRRPAKPLAIMVAETETCRRICHVSSLEEELLSSPRAPIVLLSKRPDCGVADAVAPGLAHLGVMLPYTPLHVLLFSGPDVPPALVMTSCNRSEEPIAIRAEHVASTLGDLVDGILTHDREIANRCDDSVVATVAGGPLPMRRSRGHVPEPVVLEQDAPPLLATGAMLKNVFALTSGRRVFLSQHIGDVSDADNAQHFARSFREFSRLLRLEPEAVVCDMHPDYPTTRFARELSDERGIPLMQMQHHHAHLVSCMAENDRHEPVIGVSWDGAGYGEDAAVWGGEFMVADRAGYTRHYHLEYVPLPGGDQAVRNPCRMAVAHLVRALGPDEARRRMGHLMEERELELTLGVMERPDFSPPTSSVGRLFDAVSALLGICTRATYEGQPACELEARCAGDGEGAYPFDYDGCAIRVGELFAGICADLDEGLSIGAIAAKFHNTMAEVAAETCRRLRRENGIDTVALSGGVMQNRTLVGRVAEALREEGFEVLLQRIVPPNDGGICLGQAAWGAEQLLRR